jgi:hypothetical protein
MWPAFDVGAGIEEHGRLLPRRNRRRECGPIHARDHAERRVRREHHRTRVPGAHERVRLVPRHQLRRDPHRCTRLSTECRCRGLCHLDDVWSVHHADAERSPVGMNVERPLDIRRTADQIDPGVQVTRGGHGSVDDNRRRMVTAHGVNGDADGQCPVPLFFVDGSDRS